MIKKFSETSNLLLLIQDLIKTLTEKLVHSYTSFQNHFSFFISFQHEQRDMYGQLTHYKFGCSLEEMEEAHEHSGFSAPIPHIARWLRLRYFTWMSLVPYVFSSS